MRNTLRAITLALALSFSTATVASAAARHDTCADRLCKKDRAAAPSCWRFDNEKRVARCFIKRAADHYGQSRGDALAISYRESRYQWRVNNPSGAAGLFQFMPSTWRFTPYRHKSVHNPRWAALGAMWMWKHGYKSHWSL